ncbi:hypothetical protein AAG584_19180 [Vreelandella titanicae]|uniref:hypothetical protein n=1 Tax=Vreelandella titanicae TaxID=664683 RepID=UPI00315A2959
MQLTDWEKQCIAKAMYDARYGDGFLDSLHHSIDTTKTSHTVARRQDGAEIEVTIIEYSALVPAISEEFRREKGEIEIMLPDKKPLYLGPKGWSDIDGNTYYVHGIPNTPEQAEAEWQ